MRLQQQERIVNTKHHWKSLVCRASAPRAQKMMAVRSRQAVTVMAVSTAVKTVKIGTRGSPLALAQAYLTRDLLKVRG